MCVCVCIERGRDIYVEGMGGRRDTCGVQGDGVFLIYV